LEDGEETDLLDATEVEWLEAVNHLPASGRDVTYDSSEGVLRVGGGRIGCVRQEVWDFSVTGWPVVPRWLEHRTARGRGKRGSELDNIRPESWAPEWTDELLDLLRTLTATVDLRPKQADLLERILGSPLVPATDLPAPRPEEQAVPATEADSASADELALPRSARR